MRSSKPPTRIAQTLFVILSLLTVSFAQSSPPPKRKKIKNFGSSLKRLKWNPEKNSAVDITQAKTEGAEVGDDDVIRTETLLVSSELLVLDSRGNHVSGLTADDFAIAEEGEAQTVGHFVLGDNANVPRTIVLIIDYSESQLPFIRHSVAAAKVLVDKLGPKDLMAIVTDDVELLLDFSNDKNKLKEKLDSLLKRTKLDFRYIGNTPHVVAVSNTAR
jgi:hypothetical protein